MLASVANLLQLHQFTLPRTALPEKAKSYMKKKSNSENEVQRTRTMD